MAVLLMLLQKRQEVNRFQNTDNRILVEFWKQVYGIEISPDEIPLLKVKMMNSENVFTYPPSMCFFGNDSLLIYANVQKFIENKKYTLKAKMDDVIQRNTEARSSHWLNKTRSREIGCFPTF